MPSRCPVTGTVGAHVGAHGDTATVQSVEPMELPKAINAGSCLMIRLTPTDAELLR